MTRTSGRETLRQLRAIARAERALCAAPGCTRPSQPEFVVARSVPLPVCSGTCCEALRRIHAAAPDAKRCERCGEPTHRACNARLCWDCVRLSDRATHRAANRRHHARLVAQRKAAAS